MRGLDKRINRIVCAEPRIRQSAREMQRSQRARTVSQSAASNPQPSVMQAISHLLLPTSPGAQPDVTTSPQSVDYTGRRQILPPPRAVRPDKCLARPVRLVSAYICRTRAHERAGSRARLCDLVRQMIRTARLRRRAGEPARRSRGSGRGHGSKRTDGAAFEVHGIRSYGEEEEHAHARSAKHHPFRSLRNERDECRLQILTIFVGSQDVGNQNRIWFFL
jgi:hypothetical protein